MTHKPVLLSRADLKKWTKDYARLTASFKGLAAKHSTNIKGSAEALERAYSTIYRGVAFDVDGTLTVASTPEIDKAMAAIVGSLLRQSVPVLLITGRGRSSTREAAHAISRLTKLSMWYLRGLRCMTHNGVFYLTTPEENPLDFLAVEKAIADPVPDIEALYECVRIRLSDVAALRDVTKEPSAGGEEPRAVRVLLEHEKCDEAAVEKVLLSAIDACGLKSETLYITRGAYGSSKTYDIATTNKGIAVRNFARDIGAREEQILYIGDQGDRRGNDFDLLNRETGFSVGKLSDINGVCHPIVDIPSRTQLMGSEATRVLLDRVMLFPAISVEPGATEVRLRSLRAFERIASSRARTEAATAAILFRARLRYLLEPRSASSMPLTWEISDIFDEQSGGVRFRDWELVDDLGTQHPGFRLFDLDRLFRSHSEPPRSRWSMFTDSSILLRGPDYYYGLTHERADISVHKYVDIVLPFIKEAVDVLAELGSGRPALVHYKLMLAICDNIRNVTLLVQYAAFMEESSVPGEEYHLTRRIFKEVAVPQTAVLFDLLLNQSARWFDLIDRAMDITRDLIALLECVRSDDIYGGKQQGKSIRAWRECDYFFQNITAVQLGFNELVEPRRTTGAATVEALGVVYGGVELPAIAKIVGRGLEVEVNGAFCQVSRYHDKTELGRKIRAGNYEEIKDALRRGRPIFREESPTSARDGAAYQTIILDDNCTTGSTLQFVRDMLLYHGSDVRGAVIVRFPSINRQAQMKLENHGFANPDVLFSFVRGLVASAPYSRLMYVRSDEMDEKKRYLDETGSFDKARDRIIRYLRKNGTPAEEVRA